MAENLLSFQTVGYKECYHNFGAAEGGIYDGCFEFSFNDDICCAACGCLRSFHRPEKVPNITDTNISSLVRYKECHHNVGAKMGGILYDGCFEFSSNGNGNIFCAACGCHRSFHRPEKEPNITDTYISSLGNLPQGSQPLTPSQLPPPPAETVGATPKRPRITYTKEQRVKMQEFAERTGWKIGAKREKEIKELCQEIGIGSQNYRTWVKNKKAAQRKN